MFLQVNPILFHVGAMAAPGCIELDKGEPVLGGGVEGGVVELEVLAPSRSEDRENDEH